MHARYGELISTGVLTLSADDGKVDKVRGKLKGLFDSMMKHLHASTEGAEFKISILDDAPMQDFIEGHTDVLNSAIEKTPMSKEMKAEIMESNRIFSGMKTFHELNEAFPSMIGEDGEKRPFKEFLDDVRAIDKTYNENYLRAEYNYVQSSGEMAGKWEQISKDGDRYNLQYRTMGDELVRDEHKKMEGITLPPSDPFWDTNYPPNGWNCRCTVVQVRKGKYPETNHAEAVERAKESKAKDKNHMFDYNVGKRRQAIGDYNPYTIKRCDSCKGKNPQGTDLCTACQLIRNNKNK